MQAGTLYYMLTTLARFDSQVNERSIVGVLLGTRKEGCFHMADYRIDCVNKPDRDSPHERISHVGGPKPNGSGRWKDTVANVVGYIERKQHRFYTREGGASAWVGVRTSAAGNKFLQTHADGIWKDNLLALPEC